MRDGPMAGRWSGSQGRKPTQVASSSRSESSGTRRAARARTAAGEREVDRPIEAAALAGGSDDDVTVRGGLEDRRDLAARIGACGGEEVRAVDDLAPEEARIRVWQAKPAELALARFDREVQACAGGERRRPRPCREHGGGGAKPLAGRETDAARLDRRDLGVRAKVGSVLGRGCDQTPRDGLRVALNIGGHEERAVDPAAEARFEGAEPVRVEQPCIDAGGSESLRPRGLGAPGALVGVDDQAAFATHACGGSDEGGVLVEHRHARDGQGELVSGVLVRAHGVALAATGGALAHAGAVEQRHGHAAARELIRGRGADDAGADHDHVPGAAHARRATLTRRPAARARRGPARGSSAGRRSAARAARGTDRRSARRHPSRP